MADVKRRAVVAMSGGVDSSTVAGLLVEDGWDVVGITMQLYDHGPTSRNGSCCSLDDVHDARRVAEALSIPHYVVNFQEAFQRLVVDDLAREYLAGRTPNPCVRCNEFLKFRLLHGRALALGADFLATGHYARIDQHPQSGRWRLLRALDPDKDQSYFLHPVGQTQLAQLRFPLGGMRKSEVRAHAARFGLPVAQKAESQDVCFLAGGSYRSFLERANSDLLPGDGELVTTSGQPVGRHGGHHRFTIGQRRGIGIAAESPRYVVGIDAERNQVIVGGADELLADGLEAQRVHWISGTPPSPDQPLTIKVRFRSSAAPGRVLEVDGARARMRFEHPVRAVTPGQTVVVYDGDEVLGGGVIERSELHQVPGETAGCRA